MSLQNLSSIKFLSLSHRFSVPALAVAAVLLGCVLQPADATERNQPLVNRYGAPVVDATGHPVTYDRKSLHAMACESGNSTHLQARTGAPVFKPCGFAPAGAQTQQPFWGYAVFGTAIGSSNIVIGPTSPGELPEILVGGDVEGAGDGFWQSIRYNAKSGNYDAVFVSPLYTPREGGSYGIITRIGVAHVTSASDQQIVVMLYDGRIYLYDFATKTQVGFLDVGPFSFSSGLYGLSLTDLDDDGFAELIMTTPSDLYVFTGSGQLLWQVPGAGGFDVVAGKMDNGASLKIAATNGKVVDAVTHGVVWDYLNGFGLNLKLAPFPGEIYEQLISAEAWQFVYSYDVGRQLPRWSIPTPQDIGAIDVADVDNDGTPEVIIGDGQWGQLHVYDINTQTLRWEIPNPGWGVTNVAVADVNNNGVLELLWGSTTPDTLTVASTAGAHGIEWQSPQLRGAFVGPAIGDLDGDGQPELVICSQGSGLADSGRILVFDFATLGLRAMSAPVVDNRTAVGVHDLKLRDVDGDSRMEIVIASDDLYDGAIEIYRFDSDNTFTRIWTNATRPFGNPFNLVEAADLDNNGAIKIIGGNTVATTASDGTYVYIYDYPSGTESWRSVNLASDFSAVTGLVVEDLDGNGSKEIAALIGTGDLYTWDGLTRELRDLQQATGGTVLSNRPTPVGLVLGDTSGVGHFWQWASDNYTEIFTRQLSTECDTFSGCFNGINVALDDSLWTGSGGTLTQRLAPSYDTVVWQSPAIGNGFGRFVAQAARNGQNCVFSSALHAVVGLTAGPTPTPTPTPTPCTGRCSPTPRPRPIPAPRP